MPSAVMIRNTIIWIKEWVKITNLAGARILKLISKRVLCGFAWPFMMLWIKEQARDALTGRQEVEAVTALELLREGDKLNLV